MSYTTKETGTKPYAELLEYLDAIFNSPTVNAMMLLSSVFYLSPEMEMAMNELTDLQLLFMGTSASGSTKVSFEMNEDETVGPNHARKSEWRDYITLKAKVERNFLTAMIKNPSTQKLFKDTIAKVEFGKTQRTEQTTRDTKMDEIMESLPGRQPPTTLETPEREEESFVPLFGEPKALAPRSEER